MSVKLLKEALYVKDYYDAGWSREEIAEDVGKSPAWVQTRCMILDLDVEVRKLFMENEFLVGDVRRLYSIKNDTSVKQVELANKLIAANVARKASKNATKTN